MVNPDSIAYLVYSFVSDADFEVEITNLGTESIHSFSLFSSTTGGFNCAQSRVFEHINDANIAPGTSQIFHLNMSIGFMVSNHEYVHQLNFGVFAPNYHFDMDLSNNDFIADFPTAIKETFSEQIDLKLYPNPN